MIYIILCKDVKKLSGKKERAQLSSGQLFWRSMRITLILAFAVLLTVFGAAKAYTAIRKNGFGEQRRALEVEQTSSGVRVRFFDYEGVLPSIGSLV